MGCESINWFVELQFPKVANHFCSVAEDVVVLEEVVKRCWLLCEHCAAPALIGPVCRMEEKSFIYICLE
jgi:hypothetical protein